MVQLRYVTRSIEAMEDSVDRHLRERREAELDDRIAATGRDLDRSLSGEALAAKYGLGTSSSIDYEERTANELAHEVHSGDPQEAIRQIDSYRRGFSRPPAWLLVLRAEANLLLGRWEQACDDTDEAMAADPPCGPAYAVRAMVELADKSPFLAYLNAQRAIKLVPSDARGYAISAASAHAHPEGGDPVAFAERAVEIDPEWLYAREVLAEAYWNAGRVTEAWQECRLIIDNDPDNSAAWRILRGG